MKETLPSASQARYALWVLLAVNLFNYLDRQVLYSLLPLIQADLKLSDEQAGTLASAFMVVYMLAAPPIGYWADRGGRRLWIAGGIVLWSVFTAASGLARRYETLFLARAAVGIGESCYGAVSPAFIAEHFPPERRGRILAVFSMAIPVGSALGYVAGGMLGEAFGWRTAFAWVGLPGLALAALAWKLKDPRPAARVDGPPPPGPGAFVALFKVPSFALVTLAGAAMTFCLGGLAVWMPSFLHRQWGMSLAEAGTVFGGLTVVSGVLGSLSGGWLADWALRYTSRAYFAVSGAGLLLGMPLAMASVLAGDLRACLAALFLAEFFLFLNMGPLNAVIVSVTGASVRSMAFAANIFVIHALGDAVSPTIIGACSDRWGLRAALLASCVALGVSAGFCFWGTRRYDADARSAKHA